MLAGAAQGFATDLELVQAAGVVRYASSEATPAWAETISRMLSFGTVIPLMVCGVIAWVRQKTPMLFLSGLFMFVFAAVGPATGNMDLVFLFSMMGEVLMLLFFWLMFIAIPRRQVSWKNAFWGAAFAAAGWVLFSTFFSIFVENFSNYATIYGSLAAIVILMMWLFICMYILLIGGELAVWLQTSSIKSDMRRVFRVFRRRRAQQGADRHDRSNEEKQAK